MVKIIRKIESMKIYILLLFYLVFFSNALAQESQLFKLKNLWNAIEYLKHSTLTDKQNLPLMKPPNIPNNQTHATLIQSNYKNNKK